jgi:hypothetical protein
MALHMMHAKPVKAMGAAKIQHEWNETMVLKTCVCTAEILIGTSLGYPRLRREIKLITR